MAVECPEACMAQAGKYLSFVLDSREYGIEILKVQEIKGLAGLTRVPQLPEYVRGVINLRGRVIPVIDLRQRFGLPACPDTEHNCLIIVQVVVGDDEHRLGLVVDAVSDVVNLEGEQIEAVVDAGEFPLPADCFDGRGRVADRTMGLLSVEGVFDGADLETIVQATG